MYCELFVYEGKFKLYSVNRYVAELKMTDEREKLIDTPVNPEDTDL